MSRHLVLLAVILVIVTGIATVHPAQGQEEPVHGYSYRWGDLADGTHIEPDVEHSAGHEASLSAYTNGHFTEVGEERFLTILCEVPGVTQYRQYDQEFFDGQFQLLQEYWSTASYGKMSLTGEATDWLTLTRSLYEYRTGHHGWDGTGLLFAQDCTAAAQQAGFDLEAYTGVNLVTNAFNGSAARGGFYCNLDRCWRATWLPPWGWRDISVISHEIGHSFGWGHSAAHDGHSYKNPFDVMSNTFLCQEIDPVYGCLPQHTRGENRRLAGWISAERYVRILIGEPIREVTLDLITAPATGDLPLLVEAVSWPEGQHKPATYQIEVREHLDRYDGQLPETGVVVHEYLQGRAGESTRLLQTFGSNRLAGLPGDTFYVPGYVEICVGERAGNGAITVEIATNGLRCGNASQVFLPLTTR